MGKCRHRKIRFAGHLKGVSYFGVIQVIDFCNGKVIGDRLPPESRASETEGGNVIHSLQDLVCVVMAFLLPQLLGQLLSRWESRLTHSHHFLPDPKSLVQCLTLEGE